MAARTNKSGAAATKAAKVADAVKGGVKGKVSKARTSPHFFRPKTLTHNRTPKAPTHLVAKHRKVDDFRILVKPLTSESALKKVEMHNTLVFECDIGATKNQIRAAVTRVHNVKVVKVNTLITPACKKKAFVRLAKEHDALELANKIGVL